MTTPTRLRMYIVLRRDLSPAAAFLAYGHATLGTYLTWQDDPIMQAWQRTSFVKIALGVAGHQELAWAKTLGEHRVFTESTLGNLETCLGFRVVERPDPRFKTLKPWVQPALHASPNPG
jgi:hypothetical protein